MQKRPVPFKQLVMLSAVVAAGSTGSNALAQDPALEEVMVTAQKREESLQDTPIAITAFGTKALEEYSITELTDLKGYVPSFSIAPFAATKAAPIIFIRGMGNIDVQTTKDGAVGTYLDGVVMSRASGLAADVADLERIEILRGPQGTLYGRNTTAGAINYITAKPTDEFAFKQQITAGNYNHWLSKTTVNIPFSDNFFGKLAYMRSKTDGWVENLNLSNLPDQTDFNADDKEAANLALRWQASDNFMIDYSFDYSDLEYGNGYYQIMQGDFAVNPNGDREDTAPAYQGLSPSKTRVTGHNLTLSWDLNAVTLKSITGYRELKDSLNQNYIDFFVQANSVDQNQISQEFQAIGSAFDDSFQYVAGLYYFKEEADESQVTVFAPDQDIWSVTAESESLAAYGQATWTPNILNNRLGFTLGLRYTEDEREATKTYIDSPVWAGGAPNGTTIPGNKDFSNTSGTFVVDYAFSDTINSYFKVASGYRAGGFNTRATAQTFGDGFDQENVLSYELGFKSDLINQRLRLNVAAYYNQYDDLQVDQVTPAVIYTDTINAGDSTIKGAELELTALITRGLTADFFYAYIDAEYGEYLLTDPMTGVVEDFADVKQVPYSPEGQSRLGLEYAFPQGGYGQFSLRLDYLWQDEFWSGPNLDTVNDSYGILNGRAQLVDIPLKQGSMRIGLWGKNLTDEEYTIITSNLSPGQGAVSSQFGMPRTYGIDFIYEY